MNILLQLMVIIHNIDNHQVTKKQTKYTVHEGHAKRKQIGIKIEKGGMKGKRLG